MTPETFTWLDFDQWTLQGYRWLPQGDIRGIIHILHGMTEHALNYRKTAQFLTDHGFAVYAQDLRGHGQSAKLNPPLGYLGSNGWQAMIENVKDIQDKIQTDFPEKPVFILGHSMGTFLAQAFAAKYGQNLKGLILSGTSFEPASVTLPSLILAKTLSVIWGPKSKGKLFYSIIYGGFNRKFFPNRTPFDWLSRDNTEVDAYCADPLCGFVPSLSFFYELFSGLLALYGKNELKMISKNLPIYLFSGDSDPVSHNGKSLKTLIALYRKRGNPLDYHLYKDGRHVMLAETNAAMVHDNLLHWIEAHLERKYI